MEVVHSVTCPVPDDPVLAQVASALNEAGAWGVLVDHEWRLVYMTDDLRLSNGGLRELVPVPTGQFIFGPAAVESMLEWSGRVFSVASYRAWMQAVGAWLLHDTPGGRAGIRDLVDPRLADLVDGLSPADESAAITYASPGAQSMGARVNIVITAVRLHDAFGRLAGTAMFPKPAARMALMGAMTSIGDLQHFERMLGLVEAARRPAAILFADLEASSPLARRLSTASYFTLGRRLVRIADQCVVDGGGMVGRHSGDGFVGFFLAQHLGSESRAARACVTAMRELRAALPEIATRTGLDGRDIVLRFGLHWGATLHVGQIITAARGEVNALGDEMNEAARVEACASGGRALATKALIERLEPDDALALELDPSRLAYTPLAALPTATEKARRDAPAIAVCEL